MDVLALRRNNITVTGLHVVRHDLRPVMLPEGQQKNVQPGGGQPPNKHEGGAKPN